MNNAVKKFGYSSN